MTRTQTRSNQAPTSRRRIRLPLAGLITLTIAAGSLAAPAGALAQTKGGATPAPVKCDGWAPAGTLRSTTVTTFLPGAGPVTKITWEVCGADGKWAPTSAPTIARAPSTNGTATAVSGQTDLASS